MQKNTKEILYRLFFTKNDDMDLTQIMFILCVLYFFLAFGLTGAGIWKVSVAAWSVFGTVFITLALAGTPTHVAKILAQARIGDVTRGISQSESEDQ